MYKRIAITLGIIAFVATGTTLYTMFNGFSIDQPGWATNLLVGLTVTFLVCEVIITPFFLLDDLGAGFRWLYRTFTAAETDLVAQPRRQFLKKAGVLFTMLPFASFLYGITRGKYNFWVNKKQVFFENLPNAFDGFRILQISDVHAGSFDDHESVRSGIRLIQKQEADMIVFTGDLVNVYSSEIEPFLDDFKALSAPYGKHSILGNHDYSMYGNMFDGEEHRQRNIENIKAHHFTMGFNLLLNNSVKIEKDDASFRLVGVENWGRSKHFPKLGDLDMATANCEENAFTVLLSHDPTHWADKVLDYQNQIDLTLSGHTHGMQMGVDLSFFKWSPAKYVYPHWAGLYEELGRKLYVNRGFGFLGFAGRVGIFPEITVLELKKGSHSVQS
ncbi:MAG: metallophosphoesterase [Aureispira sp.]|nr:metallophosphoesterase [Aureispira sp.]